MSNQYLRRVSIVVTGTVPLSLDFALFRCRFEVRKGDSQTPNACNLRIYNLKSATANQLANVNSEFKTLTISVGYGESTPITSLATIFSGAICQVRAGRESQRDTYVDITAASGDKAYNYATINQNQVKANPGGVAAALNAAISSFGIAIAPPPANLSPSISLRSRTLFGAWKDEMRCFSWQNDCEFSIQDDTAQIQSMSAYTPPGPPVIISPTTGLIGTPEQTANGIVLRTLMNPAIKIGSMIELQATVSLYEYQLGLSQQTTNFAVKGQDHLDVNNNYYVMNVNHTGDTRGNEWYSSLVCLALDAYFKDVNLTGQLVMPGIVPTNSVGPEGVPTSNRIDGPGPL